MAFWSQFTRKEQLPSGTEKAKGGSLWPLGVIGRSDKHSENKNCLIATGLTIEGKIEAAGHVRIAGRFKGEVHVKGDLTVEPGSHISGEIRAENVVVSPHRGQHI